MVPEVLFKGFDQERKQLFRRVPGSPRLSGWRCFHPSSWAIASTRWERFAMLGEVESYFRFNDSMSVRVNVISIRFLSSGGLQFVDYAEPQAGICRGEESNWKVFAPDDRSWVHLLLSFKTGVSPDRTATILRKTFIPLDRFVGQFCKVAFRAALPTSERLTALRICLTSRVERISSEPRDVGLRKRPRTGPTSAKASTRHVESLLDRRRIHVPILAFPDLPCERDRDFGAPPPPDHRSPHVRGHRSRMPSPHG